MFSGDMRAWDMIVDTNLDVLDPKRSPNAPKNLQDLKKVVDNLGETLSWSQQSLDPLLNLLGRRLARVFRHLIKLMQPLMKLGGGNSDMLEQMKKNSGDKYLGRVLLELVQTKSDEDTDVTQLEKFLFADYKLESDQLSQDFYLKARKIPLSEFWRQQFEKYQGKMKSQDTLDTEDDIKFVGELIRKYL